MSNAHSRLREATKALHRELDSMPQMRQLMCPELSEDEYALVLESIYSWLQQLAPLIRGLSLPDFARIDHKLHALKADLKQLNAPIPSARPPLNGYSEAYVWGIHYVVEGSFMGARVLAPRIEAALKRDDLSQYYRLYGERTIEYWQESLATLEQQLNSEEKLGDACEGAAYAFTQLARILSLSAESPLPMAMNG